MMSEFTSLSSAEEMETSTCVSTTTVEGVTVMTSLENATIMNTTATAVFELPLDMRFNEGHVLSIATYSVLLVISATGNITVLSLLLQRRRNTHSRINTMLLHLAIADLLVTFLLMPLEIAWAATVSWRGGDALCRIMAFFRTFGLFLSSFILVCISLDRYFAVMRPMSLTGVDRRGKVMLTVAWASSVACSLPQMAVFHLERHPNITWYEQCVTFNAFPSERHEVAYAVFGMVMMYGLPLAVIVFSYASILAEIFRRSRDLINDEDRIRRSSLGFLGRAKIRTLKMTIIIVFVFFVCWTPYYVMCLWYWCDKTSALKVDQRVQKALFLFACTNSCMNPIVYGAFNIRVRRAVQKYTHGVNHGREADGDVLCLVRWRRVNTGSLQVRDPGVVGPAVTRCGGVRRRPRGRRFAVPAKCVTCGGEAVLPEVATAPLPRTTPGTI